MASVSLAAVFVDQLAVQSGTDHQLAWLLTGLQEPNFASIEKRIPRPATARKHAALADPRWVAACLGYVRDMDIIDERTKKMSQKKPGKGKDKGDKGKDTEE